ncbi:MAG: YigZ family protein [Bacteroidota bacterium]
MLFEDTYRTLASPSQDVYKEKGSKFIGLAYPALSEDEVKEILKTVKKDYFDATHHCFAYQLGFDKTASRMNDDGEPSGTAGRPIFGQIQSLDLTQVLVVVVRYYGGTKLGVSGLIHAYKTAARAALDQGKILEKMVKEIYRIYFLYEQMNEVMHLVKEHQAEVLDAKYENECELEIAIRRNFANRMTEPLRKKDKVRVLYIKSQ